MRNIISLAIVVTSIFASPTMANFKVTERQTTFGECRAMLQALAGALSGKLAEYSRNTSSILESSFESIDGGTKYTITCLADEQKMVIRKEPT